MSGRRKCLGKAVQEDRLGSRARQKKYGKVSTDSHKIGASREKSKRRTGVGEGSVRDSRGTVMRCQAARGAGSSALVQDESPDGERNQAHTAQKQVKGHERSGAGIK